VYRVTLGRDWRPDDFPMPKKPFKLPVVLSAEEVNVFLSSIVNIKHRTILMTAYAAGLRISEATHLKVPDVDSQRMVIRVDQGKGNKDRYVMLSPRLLEALRSHWCRSAPRHGCFLVMSLAVRSRAMPWAKRAGIPLAEQPQRRHSLQRRGAPSAMGQWRPRLLDIPAQLAVNGPDANLA